MMEERIKQINFGEEVSDRVSLVLVLLGCFNFYSAGKLLNGDNTAIALEALRFIFIIPILINWFSINPIWHFVSVLFGLYFLQFDTSPDGVTSKKTKKTI